MIYSLSNFHGALFTYKSTHVLLKRCKWNQGWGCGGDEGVELVVDGGVDER